MRSVFMSLLLIGLSTDTFPQPAPTPRRAFDVISIKRNVGNPSTSRIDWRPDGGVAATNVSVATLIARAYPPAIPADVDKLPAWAQRERYDIKATATLSQASADDRAALLRALLEERFKLSLYVELVEEAVYDLVLARQNRALGPDIRPAEVDCPSILASRDASEPVSSPLSALQRNGPPPPCTLRMVLDRLEGDTTMENLARFLRPAAGRVIIDRTDLAGYYHVTMTFDFMATNRGPDTQPRPGSAPVIFTAVGEQLGMKLQSSRGAVPKLVVSHIEEPTEN
jgi:uncharacterized protein (TIGR03435 family)